MNRCLEKGQSLMGMDMEPDEDRDRAKIKQNKALSLYDY